MLGAKVVTASDSSGYVYDKDGIDVALLKQVKGAGKSENSKVHRIKAHRKIRSRQESMGGSL